tara:strand:- start:441 stop:1286 length:846 start_codon:yes stop_codon:yes gene_type:complete
MATLTGQTIAATYKRLLTIDSDNFTADDAAKYIKDGDAGTSSVLSLSTTRVGIGTDSPSTKLEIKGTGDPNLVCQLKATALTDTDYASFTVRGTGNGVENISRFGIIYEDGADTNAPTGYIRLDPSDGTANFFWSTDSNVFMVSTTSTNIGTTGGTVVGSQSSDERLKDISSDTFPYGLAQVNAITPIKYQFKDDPHNKNRLGFGAQTIGSIIPESVYDTGKCIDGYDVDNDTEICTPKSDNTDYELAMEYVQIIPVLVKAVQELSASNDALKARIEVLEA